MCAATIEPEKPAPMMATSYCRFLKAMDGDKQFECRERLLLFLKTQQGRR
jgi:hypothetical protein